MPAFRDALTRALSAAGVEADVVVTDNRVTLVSLRKKNVRRGAREVTLEVRVSQRLADRGAGAIDPIVAFVAGRRGGRARLLALIREIPHAPSPAPRRSSSPHVTRGRHHDLAALAEAERAHHFPELAPIDVTWGTGRKGRRLSAIRLGSYEPQAKLIRIHPRLDDSRVPAWFIGFILFHEYLHHAIGLGTGARGGRRKLHPPEFRRREALHPRYADALAWERAHIRSLLSARW